MVALVFVASPFYVRQAQAAFASLDHNLSRRRARWARRRRARSRAWRAARAAVARHRRWRSRGAVRSGEFGATLMFAGSFRGVTQTAPLAIFERFATDFTAALALSAVLVAVSAAMLLVVKLLAGRSAGRACSRLRRSVALRDFALDVDARGRARAASRSPAPRAPARRTILRVCAGLVRPERGRVVCGGDDLARHRARGVGRARRSGACGFLFQDYALFPHMPAWQNVAYGMRRSAAASGAGRGRGSCSSASGSAGWPTSHPAALSGGERQRVALARALAQLAARAAARRAAGGARRAHARRRRARAGMPRCGTPSVPALLVTHDFADAALLGDEVAVIDRGRVLQRGLGRRAGRRAGVGVRGRLRRRQRPAGDARPRPAASPRCSSTAAGRSSAPTGRRAARPRACSRGR